MSTKRLLFALLASLLAAASQCGAQSPKSVTVSAGTHASIVSQ